MSTVEIVKTFVTALQAGELNVASNYMADNFMERGLSPRPMNRSAFLVLQSELNAAMPDFSYNLAEARSQGNIVLGLVSIEGTQVGDLSMPFYHIEIPATSLSVRLPQVRAEFILNDEKKIVELRVESIAGGGLEGLIQQLGGELRLLPRLEHQESPKMEE